jgi:hypothetical protein
MVKDRIGFVAHAVQSFISIPVVNGPLPPTQNLPIFSLWFSHTTSQHLYSSRPLALHASAAIFVKNQG